MEGKHLSMLARKMTTEERLNQQPQTTVTTVVHKKKKISLGEKILYIALALVLTVLSVNIISNQYSLYTLNKDISQTERAIEEMTKKNNDLNVQVSELSSYERIWAKASELGLTLVDNNVKVCVHRR